MAGTDRTKPNVALGGPAVILVDPQLGENIGMVARAMLNCGLHDLRLVRPRDGWPNPAAKAAAAGAVEVLDGARAFETTAAAIADLSRLYAATVRPRGLIKPVMTPKRAAAALRADSAQGMAAGVLLGPERSGLTTDDVALADAAIEVPLNPAFASLNLAQAVLLIGYEWFQLGTEPPPLGLPAEDLPLGDTRPANKAELVNFFERLETTLDETGFMHPPEQRPTMVRNLRTMLTRADLTEQEVRTLHGILSALLGAKLRRRD